MNSIIYLLQVSACTGVFYLFYYLFLNRLTFFVTNRWYLLVTVVLSFLIPLIKIPISQPHVYTGVVQQVIYTYTAQENITPIVVHPQVSQSVAPIQWGMVLKLAYLAAVLGLTIHLIVTLIAFFKRLKGKRITKLGNVHVLRGNEKIVNGSFLNYIFLNDEELSADEMQQIIAHEMLHVKLFHSVDRIIVKLAQIILWFNPFIYLYSRSVEENHEFEVDRAMATGTDKHNYANLLLHLSVAGQGMLYHNFSKVPLKKRISMLFNKPSTNMKKIVYILIVPVVLISCLAFAGLKSIDKDPQYSSVLNKLTKLGKNPLVTIDNKIYTKDILYKIGKACIKDISIWRPDAGIVKHGIAIKDGYVEIKTKKGTVTYMTDIEKENLAKEYAVSQAQFYSRLHLKEEDGSLYDKIIMHVGDSGAVSTNVKTGAKVGFVIDSKVFTENEIKHVPVHIIKSLSGAYGVGGPESFPETTHLKQFEAVFSFKTKKAEKLDLKGSNIPAEKASPKVLYTRTPVNDKTGRPYDVVKLQDVAGSYAKTEVAHDANIGFFVDKDFYSEDQFKTLPEDRALEIAKTIAVGVTDKADFSKLEKEGYQADWDKYAAVFHIYLKTKPVGWDASKRKQPDAMTIDKSPQYSAIDGVERLGKNPVVLIDGKEYKKDILYKISPSCIGGTGVWDPDPKFLKHGVYIKDGYIDITTKHGIITYMTKLEKENLIKERSVPQSQFFVRINLKNADGTSYDKVIVHIGKTGKATTQVKPGGKVGFLIDQKFYTEAEIKSLSPQIIANLSGGYGVGGSDNFPETKDLKDYEAVFNFKSKPPVATGSDPKGNNMPKEKGTPKLLYTSANVKPDSSSFFKRTHYQNGNGTSHDRVRFTLSDGASGLADLGTTDKVGIFIDHEFYNEAAILKLSPEITSKLTFDNTHTGFDGLKLPKGDYAIPFKFVTKKAATPPVKADGLNGYNATAQTDTPKFVFTRTEYKGASGESLDEVQLRRGSSGAGTELAHNALVGFFIDRDFYTEEQFKKLPESMVIALGKTSGCGVMPDADIARLKKYGYVTDGGKYEAIFFLFLKTQSTILDTYIRDRRAEIEKAKRTGALKNPVTKPADDKLVINRADLTKRTKASATDSAYFDRDHDIISLYGNAELAYGPVNLKADYVKIDEEKHLVFASGFNNPKTKIYSGTPMLFDKNNSRFYEADSIIVETDRKTAILWRHDQDPLYIRFGNPTSPKTR